MIDLSKFTKVSDVFVPIVNGWGQINGRKIIARWKEDGWYSVRLGNQVEVERKATPMEITKTLKEQKFLRVYALGAEGIPTNFDNFLRRGFGEAVRIYFLDLPVFEVAKVVLWEDNRFYYYESDSKFQRGLINDIRQAFETEEKIADFKDITPELSYYWLLVNLERQSYREVEKILRLKLSEAEKAKRVAQFANTFEGRLKKIIEEAGGELVRFVKSNKDSYLVHWKVNNQLVKSTIKDDMRILSAGYCLSGDDRKHTMGSIIQLAKMFQRGGARLYITRQ